MDKMKSLLCGRLVNPERKRDKGIVNLLKKHQRELDREFKILLLGTGDSGKSTVYKQMQFLYGTQEENSVTAVTIKDSVFPCFNSVIVDAQLFLKAISSPEEKEKHNIPSALPPLSETSQAAAEIIKGLSTSPVGGVKIQNQVDNPAERGYSAETGLNADVAAALKNLWEDETIQEIWVNHRSHLQVSDSWSYFMSNIAASYPTFGGPKWLPTDDEFLLIRVKTTGIRQCSFSVNQISKGEANDVKTSAMRKKATEDSKLTLIDVGGQRSERKKWITVFDGVPVVLFVTALSEYNQVMYEDLAKNRLSESLDVFEQMCHTAAFAKTGFILFLNKSDLFREKLCDKKIALNVSGDFPDAPSTLDFDEGVQWVRAKFEDRFEKDAKGNATKPLYVHLTTATDRKNAEVVLESVRHTVVQTIINPWLTAINDDL